MPAGTHLSDLTALLYSEKATGGIDGYNAAYFRIFLSGGHDIIMSPSTQPGGPGTSMSWRRHNVLDDTVRYDDDAGNNPGRVVRVGPRRARERRRHLGSRAGR